MTDIGVTVGEFLKTWNAKFNRGPVSVEEWHAESGQVLDALRNATVASTDTASLQSATDAWPELSVLLKRLLHLDQDVHFPGLVEQACTAWWDSVTECQIHLDCTTADAYRGMASYVVAQLAFRRRDRGAALRWASLGYLADKLGGHPGGGSNEVTLRFGLGAPKEALDLLDEHARAGASRSGVERFPEWLFAEALDDPRGISLVAPSGLYAHHPSPPFVKAAAEHVFS